MAFVKRILRELTEEEKATLTNWFWSQEKRVDSAFNMNFILLFWGLTVMTTCRISFYGYLSTFLSKRRHDITFFFGSREKKMTQATQQYT
jgi:hypothetical protein